MKRTNVLTATSIAIYIVCGEKCLTSFGTSHMKRKITRDFNDSKKPASPVVRTKGSLSLVITAFVCTHTLITLSASWRLSQCDKMNIHAKLLSYSGIYYFPNRFNFSNFRHKHVHEWKLFSNPFTFNCFCFLTHFSSSSPAAQHPYSLLRNRAALSSLISFWAAALKKCRNIRFVQQAGVVQQQKLVMKR